MTDPAARRTSADALAAMGVLLTLGYHAGATYWQSRGLTLVGSLVPGVMLGLAMRHHDHRYHEVYGALGLAGMIAIGFALGTTMLFQVDVDDVRGTYLGYAVFNITAQMLLTLLWALWWRSTGDGVAVLGTVLAALGTGLATLGATGMIGAPPCSEVADPSGWCIPAPWDATASPVDALSAVGNTPALMLEAAMAGLAVCTWLAVRLPPILERMR